MVLTLHKNHENWYPTKIKPFTVSSSNSVHSKHKVERGCYTGVLPFLHGLVRIWNTAMTTASILHFIWQLLCRRLFSTPFISFDTIGVIVTTWFLYGYAQCCCSTLHYQKFIRPFYVESFFSDLPFVVLQIVLLEQIKLLGAKSKNLIVFWWEKNQLCQMKTKLRHCWIDTIRMKEKTLLYAAIEFIAIPPLRFYKILIPPEVEWLYIRWQHIRVY